MTFTSMMTVCKHLTSAICADEKVKHNTHPYPIVSFHPSQKLQRNVRIVNVQSTLTGNIVKVRHIRLLHCQPCSSGIFWGNQDQLHYKNKGLLDKSLYLYKTILTIKPDKTKHQRSFACFHTFALQCVQPCSPCDVWVHLLVKSFSVKAQYYLSVGSLHPHDNVSNI